MRRWSPWIVVMVVALAACGGGEDVAGEGTQTPTTSPTPTTETETPEPSPTSPTMGEATVAVADTSLGSALVDAEGFTLYMFDQDEEGTSNCTDDCAETWPPVTVEGEPSAGEGADEALLDTISRDDGSTQVTYAGYPLYRYAPDEAPGDVQGQAVGDVWWVLDPSGEPIRDDASAGETERTYDY